MAADCCREQGQTEGHRGSEDFSYFQQLAPGLFFCVGATRPEIDPAKAPADQSPRFHVDERALLLRVRLLAHLVMDFGEAR